MGFKGNLSTPHSANVKLVSSFLFTALENTWPFFGPRQLQNPFGQKQSR